MANANPIAKKIKPTMPPALGYPKHRKANNPNPNPESVVKMITEGAGCILNSVQSFI
jgi:hypothetical protein